MGEVGYSYAYTKCLYSWCDSLHRTIQHKGTHVSTELVAIVMALLLFEPDHLERTNSLGVGEEYGTGVLDKGVLDINQNNVTEDEKNNGLIKNSDENKNDSTPESNSSQNSAQNSVGNSPKTQNSSSDENISQTINSKPLSSNTPSNPSSNPSS